MDKQDDYSVYQKLLLIMVRAKRKMFSVCESWQLTPVQGMLLTSLDPGSSKNMHDLSKIMACDASNVTGLIDRLEANGYISRIADDRDRRIKNICLTKRGITCRKALLDALRETEAVDTGKLTADEVRALHSIADKLDK